jgi:hypothetical protein
MTPIIRGRLTENCPSRPPFRRDCQTMWLRAWSIHENGGVPADIDTTEDLNPRIGGNPPLCRSGCSPARPHAAQLGMTPSQCPKISRSALMRVRGRDNWLTASLRSGPRQVRHRADPRRVLDCLDQPRGGRVLLRAPKEALIRQGSALRHELTPVCRSRRFRGDGL